MFLTSFQDCKRGKNERIITVSEFFPKNLNDVVISIESGVNVNGDDASVDSVKYNDREVERPEFLLKVARETLHALAFLDFKGIVHTSLVSGHWCSTVPQWCALALLPWACLQLRLVVLCE